MTEEPMIPEVDRMTRSMSAPPAKVRIAKTAFCVASSADITLVVKRMYVEVGARRRPVIVSDVTPARL